MGTWAPQCSKQTKPLGAYPPSPCTRPLLGLLVVGRRQELVVQSLEGSRVGVGAGADLASSKAVHDLFGPAHGTRPKLAAC